MGIAPSGRNGLDSLILDALESLGVAGGAGHYLDIGANRPTAMSNTWSFYQSGWRGLAADPLPGLAESWKQSRPEDVFLPVAVGNEIGVLEYHQFGADELSTADTGIAARHKAAGQQCSIVEVKAITASELLETHWLVAWERPEFCSMDVEGWERQVLEGWNLQVGRHRPRLFCVESIYPNTEQQAFGEWEDILLKAGYSYWGGDRHNRIYIDGRFDPVIIGV